MINKPHISSKTLPPSFSSSSSIAAVRVETDLMTLETSLGRLPGSGPNLLTVLDFKDFIVNSCFFGLIEDLGFLGMRFFLLVGGLVDNALPLPPLLFPL
ncbi:hypothetical protein AQUCO_00600242v1 [Aquilegia coerulea]|uniref:Uncharacterized protein n=1 Tax=Aquilegia coerulea TaxID=218851 RepID=A0A2G5ENM4_AQUCA|nr:hypothetical protein AQUCO_00600242v1 [Aquilegia coerulea]